MSSRGASAIELETEPFVGFEPTLAGTARPGNVQPVADLVLLEEEPATRPCLVV